MNFKIFCRIIEEAKRSEQKRTLLCQKGCTSTAKRCRQSLQGEDKYTKGRDRHKITIKKRAVGISA